MGRSLWQRILDFFRSPREPYVAAPEPFLRLDREAVRRELQPKERGRDAGAGDLPPAEATSPDSREVGITRFCQNELDRAHEQIRKGMDALLASIRQSSRSSAEAQISQLRDRGVSQLRSVATQRRNEIEATLRHAMNLEDAFARFRQRNRRDALPDLSKGGAMSYAVLVLMVATETGMNGTLFAQGSAFGFIGGFAQAVVFSVFNVMLGVVTALAIREATHVAWWRRIPTAIAVPCLAMAGLALNLGVAQFRDALLSGTPENDATRIAVEHVRSGTLAPGDLVSWLLFALGYMFFWGACVDVLRMKDTYPGYAARYQSILRAKQDYAEAITDTHTALASVRDLFARQIADVARDVDAWGRHAASLRDNLARLSSSYQRHGADVQEFHHQLVEEYRDANRRSRSTPVPDYFSRWTELAQKPVPVYELPPQLTDVAKVAADAIGDLTATHDAELQTLLPVSELGTSTHVNSQT